MTKTQRIRAVMLLTFLATVVVTGINTPVFADEPLPTPGADSAAFTISAPVVMVILGTLIPLLNGLLTKITTSSSLKGLLTLVLNAVAAGILSAVTVGGNAIFSNQTLMTWVLGFVTSISTYYGVWRPLTLSSSTPGPMSGTGVSADNAVQ